MKLNIEDEPLQLESDPLEFDAPPREGFGDVASKIGSRNLMIAIVTMPFVFLVVVMSIVAVFGGKADDETRVANAGPDARIETRAGAVRSTPVADDDELLLQEPALEPAFSVRAASADGALPLSGFAGDAGALALDGDRLAVRLDSENGPIIVVYDLEADEVIYRVPLSALTE